jgi:hypothetical protein
VRAIPPLHEFTLDPIPQIHVADPQSVTFLHEFDFNSIPPILEAGLDLSSTPSPVESPKPRPLTTAFEPFRFSDKSDHSSASHSNPLHLRLSDMDSGVDMSDSISNLAVNNFSHESIPELMPGAQRKPEQTSADSPRHKCTCHPGRDGEPPAARSHRASVMPGVGVAQETALDYGPGLILQSEPPGDEGVLINNFSFQDDDQAVRTPPVEEISVEEPAMPAVADSVSVRASKRMTFIPEGFPAAEAGSEIARLSIPPTPPAHIDDVAAVAAALSREASLHRTASRGSMRPPSRSQPIIIGGPAAAAALPRTLLLPPRTPPPQAASSAPGLAGLMASPASTVMTATTTGGARLRPASRAASGPPAQGARLRSTSNVLVVPHPPACPPEELAMMTPECLALLRAQEQMLVRRATLLIAQAHIENTALAPAGGVEDPAGAGGAAGRAYDEMGEIGVAVGEPPPFQAPPVPPMPADDVGPSRRRHSRRSTVASVAAAVRRSPSLSFLRGGAGGKKGAAVNGSVPVGSVSMVELHRVDGKGHDAADKKRSGARKKGWWKVWRLL